MTKKNALNFIDITGQRFGKWVVLEQTEKRIRRDVVWKVQCDCGTIREVSRNSLRNGSKSCNCSKKGKGRPKNPDRPKTFFTAIKGRYVIEAKQRNLSFELTFEDFTDLVTKPCYYCGKDKQNYQNYKGTPIGYTGIDRVDNNKGYLLTNVVPCCKFCNLKKKSSTPEIIFKAYHFLKNNGTF